MRGGTVFAVGDGFAQVGDADDLWTIRSLARAGPPGRTVVDDAVAMHDLVGAEDPDFIITDHYGLDVGWERATRDAFPRARLVAFDDLSDRLHETDVVVDANLGDQGPRLMPGRKGLLLQGTHYAPLDEEYRAPALATPVSEGPGHVLITLGGGASGIASQLLKCILREPKFSEQSVTLVVPDDVERAAVLRAFGGRRGVSVHGRVRSLRPFVEAADLVVGAGGTSAWQRLRLGKPSVVVALAENQVRTCRALNAHGVARWVEDAFDTGAIAAEIVAALEDPRLHEQASTFGPLLVDGFGADRVALSIVPPQAPPKLRPARAGDAPALLGIANDRGARSGSREPGGIAPWEHLAWFEKALSRVGNTFWVAEVDGLVVGHVRFERLAAAWELSYGLDPVVRGHGWSRPLVEEGVRRLRALGGLPVVAVTHEANVASQRVLEAAGFDRDPDGHRLSGLGAEAPAGFRAYLLGDQQ